MTMHKMMIFAQVFGEKHVVGTSLLFLMSVLFLVFLPRSASKNAYRWLIVFTLLFFVLEALRLWFLLQRDGQWALYQLPLNLCSIPLYVYPTLVLGKDNVTIKKWFLPPAFATVMLAGLIALLIPSNILGNEVSWFPLENNLVEIISFTYHAVMLVAPLALIKLRYYSPSIRDIPYALTFTMGFAIVAMLINHLTGQDFLLLNVGNGSPFQFLITTSKLLYQAVMIGLGAFLISLFFIIGQWVLGNKSKE